MTISDLEYSLLSLDAYDRGTDEPGLPASASADPNQIGDATFFKDSLNKARNASAAAVRSIAD
jgi:hypothetical protein